jgi:hypothetical protein
MTPPSTSSVRDLAEQASSRLWQLMGPSLPDPGLKGAHRLSELDFPV